VTTLALDPVPETLVRVGIVHHAHAEPERVAGEKPAAAGEPAGRPAGMKPLQLEKRLTAAEATKLAAADHDLCLFGLSGLPEGTAADVAGAFGPHRHVLRAPGLVGIDAEAAAALARHAGPVELPDLRRLDSVALARKLSEREGFFAPLFVAEITAEVVAALDEGKGWTGALPALAVLTPEVAAALAASKKWTGQLPGVTAFTAPDSVAVAAALAKRKGPLSLPNLKKISPQTLSALIEKEDVGIPLVETLDIIAEPDGSPTDDFVIPEGFQAQQRKPPPRP
jgi:hypothetical protein